MTQKEKKTARLAAAKAEKERKLAEIAAARAELSKEKARKARMIAKQEVEVKAALASLDKLPSDVVEIDGQQFRIEADGALTELGTITPALSARPTATTPRQTGYRGTYPDSREDEDGNIRISPAATSGGGSAESAKRQITAVAEQARAERLSAAEILEGQPKRPGLEEFYRLREIAASLTGDKAFDLAVEFFSRINETDEPKRPQMTKTKKLSLALTTLGWVPDPKHSAHDALKGGKLPDLKLPATARFFPNDTGSGRLSLSGKKSESRAFSERYLAKIIAAAEAENAAVIDIITF